MTIDIWVKRCPLIACMEQFRETGSKPWTYGSHASSTYAHHLPYALPYIMRPKSRHSWLNHTWTNAYAATRAEHQDLSSRLTTCCTAKRGEIDVMLQYSVHKTSVDQTWSAWSTLTMRDWQLYTCAKSRAWIAAQDIKLSLQPALLANIWFSAHNSQCAHTCQWLTTLAASALVCFWLKSHLSFKPGKWQPRGKM